MTHGALRISAIAVGAAAFVSLSPLSAASAATVVHHPAHGVHHAAGGVHRQVAHVHGRVYAHHYGHAHRYAYGHAHRYGYGYGYNPGAAVAAGVIGGGYPYCDDYSDYGPYYGSCNDYSYGYSYPYYDYGYGFGGPVFVGGGRFHLRFDHGFHRGFAFHGDGAHFQGDGQFGGGHFAGANFGHMGGFGGGNMGGFGGGHMGGFGGGHMGGFGGGGHFHR
jgi:hypothetical protein